MPRILKRLLLWIGLPLALLAGGACLLGWLVLRQVTPENVVHQLEAACNSRVQLDSCSLSLFSSPARLELNGLHFHPRDSEADAATPPATRPPVKITNTYLRMRRGLLEIDLASLFRRRELHVKSLLVEMGDIKCDILPSGESSLRALFHPPATVQGKPNPSLTLLAPVAAAVVVATTESARPTPPETPDPRTPPAPPTARNLSGTSPETDTRAAARDSDGEAADTDDPGPLPAFHARDLGAPVRIDTITFSDARLRIRNRKSRAVTELNQLHLEITGLAVHPDRIADTPPATVSLRSRLVIDGGRKSPGRLADLQLRVHGSLAPFDPATGLLQPDFQFTTEIARGATLRPLQALEKIEKNLARARRAGLRIDPFPTDLVLAADTTLPFRLHHHSLALTQPATLDFGPYALALDAASAIDIATESHQLKAAWIANQQVSDTALAGAGKFLGAAGEDVARELRSLLIDPIVRNGRLHMDFTSTGELAKPDVRIAHPLQDLTDQLKDAGRGLLDRFQNN
jgi:hypothetical protein